MLAAGIGSALEWYDYFIYGMASALVFGPLFFPAQTAEMRLIASFGTYFVGFAVRPLGGVVFGVLGCQAFGDGRGCVAGHNDSQVVEQVDTAAQVARWGGPQHIWLGIERGEQRLDEIERATERQRRPR